MLFNSQLFLLVFLPLVCAAYWLLARRLPSGHPIFRALLLTASLVFYAYFDIRLLPLLLASIVINYLATNAIAAGGADRRTILVGTIALNLLVLAGFKYFNFFAETLLTLAGQDHRPFDIVLPLAISFFTFQQISALVDAWHRRLAPRSFLDYALFVAFFPQLIAGPIVRHNELVPQLQAMPKRDGLATAIANGQLLLTCGLIKKVLIADQLARLADPLFAASLQNTLSTADAWVATLAFGFQIYFDFSGYSDMAIGLALLFGVTLPINFNAPYRAHSIRDFWRRWHITLSTFLRDFLYIPLGGNRHGAYWRTIALMVTMLLGGLWHGAAWTFVLWGGLHGLALAVNHAWSGLALGMPRLLSWALTFTFVMLAFVVFRAESMASAQNIVAPALMLEWATSDWLKMTANPALVIWIPIAFGTALFLPEPHRLLAQTWWRTQLGAVILGLVFAAIAVGLGGQTAQEFIYFQF